MTLVLAGMIVAAAAMPAGAGAPAREMAALVPADAGALIEAVDLAGLRQALVESKFWAAFQDTQAAKDWNAGAHAKAMQAQVDLLLGNLKMQQVDALKAYLGGRSAVAFLGKRAAPTPPGPVSGIVLTETTADLAQRLIDATGAVKAYTHAGIDIYEMAKDGRTDRMAYTGGVLLVTGAPRAALEHVLDAATGASPSLATQDVYRSAVEGLPAGWRARAWAASTLAGRPGVVAMVPEGAGLHFEWRILGENRPDAAVNAPVALTTPALLPQEAVAAVATVLHPEAIWALVKQRATGQEGGDAEVKRTEMFIRSWFPGQTMEAITAALGPEAAIAVIAADSPGGTPGLVAMVRITPAGGPVAKSFKDGLASKAMLLASMAARSKNKAAAPKVTMTDEKYGKAEFLTVEAPGMLDKIVGDWAKGLALTVALTDEWLIVGTTPASVKAVLDTVAGTRPSLAARCEKQGVKLPAGPATRWGLIEPARSADLLFTLAEKFGVKTEIEKVQKVSTLAEMMKLIKLANWQRIDLPAAVCGTLDVQAAE